MSKEKTKAGLKIAYGVAKIASGTALIFGHGFLAIFVRGPMPRARIAKLQFDSGEKILKEGWSEWQSLK